MPDLSPAQERAVRLALKLAHTNTEMRAMTDRHENQIATLAAELAEAKRKLAAVDEWEIKAQAAELIADERGALYGQVPFDYDTVERFGDWCHAWAAQFRAHTETYPDLRAALRGDHD